jgi:hypothetical protein
MAPTGRPRLTFDTQLDIRQDWRRLPRVTQSKNGVSGYAIVLLWLRLLSSEQHLEFWNVAREHMRLRAETSTLAGLDRDRV